MAEEAELEQGSADTGETGDPAAVGIALAGASRAKADAYLDKQSLLADLQIEDAREQHALNLSHLRFRRFGDYAKAAMELTVAVLIVCLIAGFGAMAWQARAAHGLVVEPFHTPPDLANKGLDGSVLAQQVIDDLNDLVAKSDIITYRAADSIAGNWGDDSKVEIPETGIAISELSRSLHRWLGSETRLSGEIFLDGEQVSVRLRVDGTAPVKVTGSASDLDGLIARASEAVFAQTQPFRYQMYLGQAGQTQRAIALARQMALTGPSGERAWGYASWSNWLMYTGAYHEAVERANQALSLDPGNPQAESDLFLAHWALGHLEATLAADKALARVISSGRPDVAPLMAKEAGLSFQQGMEELVGAWRDSIAHDEIMTHYTIYQFDQTIPPLMAMDYAQIYDAKSARAVLKTLPQWNDKLTTAKFAIMGPELPLFFTLTAANDWSDAARDLVEADTYTRELGTVDDVRHSLIWPWLAYAEARAGQLQAGEQLVALTPLDCNLCLRMRGRLAELAGDRAAAAGWFRRADTDAPSYAFALADWGAMLLHFGNYDQAISKFAEANRRVPHFADPLEMWGEALMLKNRSDLALAKFEDANKHAPNWGRLHMKWGEALGYVGRKDEARAQYRIASTLDLSVADKAELARDMRS